jgi:hypothetical protein
MRYREIINEAVGREVVLWHGGRDVEYSYDEVRSHKGGRWEHGPGLYLTTSYTTASKYAKGGGKLYKVTVNLTGNEMDDVVIPFDDMADFVKRFVVGSKRPDMITDLKNNMARTKTDGVRAAVLVNLCLNYGAIQNTKTSVLRQFLIDHGVDYSVVNNYGGSHETVVVVINPKIIKKVEIIPASTVKDNFNLPFEALPPTPK